MNQVQINNLQIYRQIPVPSFVSLAKTSDSVFNFLLKGRMIYNKRQFQFFII